MLANINQKDLFDYWHERVRISNLQLIAAKEHVPTQILRHECTNYDELRRLPAVLELDELERCRVIAIIKYECTAQVLQRRTGLLRDYAKQCRAVATEQQQERSKLLGFIHKLKELLRGKQVVIDRLEERINLLEAENATLQVEVQEAKAKAQVHSELEALQRRFAQEVEHRQRLAKNNQSLGGRVAHTNRYRRERDELREALRLERQTSQTLRLELERLGAGQKLELGRME
jgi:hypothetical protein